MSVDAGICVRGKQFNCKWMFDIRYNFPRNIEDIVETKELLSNRKYILKLFGKIGIHLNFQFHHEAYCFPSDGWIAKKQKLLKSWKPGVLNVNDFSEEKESVA